MSIQLQLTKYTKQNHKYSKFVLSVVCKAKDIGTQWKYQHHSPITTLETQTYGSNLGHDCPGTRYFLQK